MEINAIKQTNLGEGFSHKFPICWLSNSEEDLNYQRYKLKNEVRRAKFCCPEATK